MPQRAVIIGPDRQRPARRLGGFGAIAQLKVKQREIDVKFRDIWLRRDGPRDELRGLLPIPALPDGNAEHVQGRSVLWLSFEDAPINCFGLGDLAGLMKLKSVANEVVGRHARGL